MGGTEVVVAEELLPVIVEHLDELLPVVKVLGDFALSIDNDLTDDITVVDMQLDMINKLDELIQLANTQLTLISYIFVIVIAFFVFKIIYKAVSVINGN